MNDLTPAQEEAYARASPSVNTLFSFELRHSTFPQPIRMVSYTEDLTVPIEEGAPANAGEEVVFTGVDFGEPDEEVDTEPGNTFNVGVSGISAHALPYLDAANDTIEPIACTVRWITYDVRAREILGVSRPAEMQVRNFATSMLSLQMTLGFTNLNTRTLDV